MTFLVCEPDHWEAERVAAVLGGEGHQLTAVPNLPEALEALFMEKFDAVLIGSSVSAESLTLFREQVLELASLQSDLDHLSILTVAASRSQGANPPLVCDASLPERFEAEQFRAAMLRLGSGIQPPVASETDEPELPVFERVEFEDQCAQDRDLMLEILDLSAVEREKQVPEMQAALDLRDFDRLSRIAHTLKGSLGSLRAPAAHHRAHKLESAAKQGDAESCATLLGAFTIELDELQQQLTLFRELHLCSSGG